MEQRQRPGASSRIDIARIEITPAYRNLSDARRSPRAGQLQFPEGNVARATRWPLPSANINVVSPLFARLSVRYREVRLSAALFRIRMDVARIFRDGISKKHVLVRAAMNFPTRPVLAPFYHIDAHRDVLRDSPANKSHRRPISASRLDDSFHRHTRRAENLATKAVSTEALTELRENCLSILVERIPTSRFSPAFRELETFIRKFHSILQFNLLRWNDVSRTKIFSPKIAIFS